MSNLLNNIQEINWEQQPWNSDLEEGRGDRVEGIGDGESGDGRRGGSRERPAVELVTLWRPIGASIYIP
jgi:hypothetical protein